MHPDADWFYDTLSYYTPDRMGPLNYSLWLWNNRTRFFNNGVDVDFFVDIMDSAFRGQWMTVDEVARDGRLVTIRQISMDHYAPLTDNNSQLPGWIRPILVNG